MKRFSCLYVHIFICFTWAQLFRDLRRNSFSSKIREPKKLCHFSPQSNLVTFFYLPLFSLFIFRQLLKHLSFLALSPRLGPFILFPLRRQKTKNALGHCKWEMKNIYTRGAQGRKKKERRQNKEGGKNGERVGRRLLCQHNDDGNSVCSSFSTSAISSPGILLSGRFSRKSSSHLCVLHPWAIIKAAPFQMQSPKGRANLLWQVELRREENEAIHHWFGLSRSHHLAVGRATKMDDTPRWTAPQCFCCTSATGEPANTHPTHPLAAGHANLLTRPTDENQH